MDDGKVEIDPDLSSTVGDVLLATKNDKTDANDSTPTSSTDASSSFAGTSLIVSEDPISSTSSDVMEKGKLPPEVNNEKETVVSKNLLGSDGDVDLLDMNITNVSNELISEDVEDIVQDLENLLGEPEPQHDFPTRRKEKSLLEDKDLLASLDDPLCENIESNLSPQTPKTQSLDETELVEILEKKDIQICSGGVSQNIENEINTDEQSTLKESSESVQEPQINRIEELSCQPDKVDVIIPQSEIVTEVETIEDETAEVEVSAVSSSETPAKYHPHITEENIVGGEDIEEIATVELQEQILPSPKDNVESICDNQDEPIPIETKNDEHESKESESLNTESCKIERESCDVAQLKTEKIAVSDANTVETIAEDQEFVEMKDVGADTKQDIEEELNKTENKQVEPETSCVTGVTEDVSNVLENSNILIGASEVINESKADEDKQICESNVLFVPSSEDIIQEPLETLPEIVDTSVVAAEIIDTSVVAAEVIDTSVVATEIIDTSVFAAEITDSSAVAAELCQKSSKNDLELDVDVTSSLDPPIKKDTIDQLKTPDSTISEIQQVDESNLKIASTISKEENVAVTEDLVSSDENVCDGVKNTEFSTIEQKNPSVGTEVGALSEKNVESSIDNLEEPPASLENLVPGECSKVEDIGLMQNEDVVEVNLSLSPPKQVSEEEQKQEFLITGVETVENEVELLGSIDQVDKKEILESPEESESEKECISSIDKETVGEDASLTNENTNTLLEEKLASMDGPSEQNQESHSNEQEIVRGKPNEQSSLEDILQKTEEGIIPISEPDSVRNEPLPEDSLKTEDIAKDESTTITDSVPVMNEPSVEETVESTVTSIVQTETIEPEIAPRTEIPAVNTPLMENLEEDIADSAAQEETSKQESTVTAEIISLVNEPQLSTFTEENEETVRPLLQSEATDQDCAATSEIIPIIEESPFEESKEEEIQEMFTPVTEKEDEKSVSNEETSPKAVNEVFEEPKQEQEITIQEESSTCIIEKEDGKIVGSEEPFEVPNEVSEELKQEQEITTQEEIASVETAIIETVQDKITPSTESVEENIMSCSVESMSSNAEISSNLEEKEDQELHTNVEDEGKILPDLEVAESISEGIQSEITQDQTIENLQHSNEENLVPVNEELCVKKVIIYHHDCDSHLSNQSNMQNKDEDENLRQKQNVDIVEERLETGSEELPIVKNEELASPIDQQDIEAQVTEQIEEPEIIPKISDAESAQTEEIAVETDEHPKLYQQELPVEEPVTFENENSNQKQEVSSSEQIQDISEDADELEITNQPNADIVVDPVIETSQTVEEPCDNIMEDQTSAAVQSILDNMSAEESSIVKILEKEEPPVVHSSYSSYEIQKAVQEIQCINQTEDIVEMSHENVECISSTEKLCDPVKPEFQNEIFETTHNLDQSHIDTQNAESEVSEKPQKLPDTENVDINSPSREVDGAVEQIQEIMDSPDNQESVTQSFDYVQETAPQAEEIEKKQPLSQPTKSTYEVKQQNDPVVIPSIDLSEESSSEEGSDDEKKHNEVSSSSTLDHKDLRIETVKTPAKVEKVTGKVLSKIEPKRFSPRETRHSSRISDKMNPHSLKEDIGQPLSVNVDDVEKEKPYSPKITIKPIREDEPSEEKEGHKGSLKITITKQSDNTHSILKMCSPDFEHRPRPSDEEQNVIPKLVIKTSDTHSEQHSPKISTRSSKQVPGNSSIRSGSPRITIKPIVKPDTKETITSPLKITIKPIGKPEEFSRQQQRHSPKQSKNKSDDDHYSTRSKMMKSSDSSEVHSPKVTIKPVKPPEEPEMLSTPKITIKPIEKPDEARVSPKITIKPVMRPVQMEAEGEEEVKERIVLKINRGNLPTKETERMNRKRELEDDKSEKLAKIKLKFSKDGDAHIVHKKSTDTQASKRQHDFETERSKRMKAEATDSDEDVKLIETRQSPIVISEDSQSQDSVILIEDAKDPLADVAIPEPQPQVIPVNTPRKRGRPRKVPLVVRQEFTIEPPQIVLPATSPIPVASVEQPAETETTGRPKRSCRAQSARDTLGIKPRKAYKPRGGKRGAKSIQFKPEKEPGFSAEKIDIIKKSLLTEEAIQDAGCSGTLKVSSESSLKKVDSEKVEPIKPLGLKGLLEAAKDQNIIEVIEIDTPSNSPKCLEPTDKIEEESVIEEKIDITDKDTGSENIAKIKVFEIQKEVLDLREETDCNKESSDFGGSYAAASDVEMQPPTPVFAPPLIETSAVDMNSTTDIAMFEEETRMSADASSRAQTPAKQVVSADVVVEESQSSMQSTATTESGKISRKSRLEVHQDQDGSVFTADQLNEYYWGGNGPFMIQEQVAQFLGIKSFKRKYPGIPRRMVDMQERDHIRENGLASESMCDLGLTAVNSADILDIMYTDFQEKYEEFCRLQRDKQAKDLLNKQKALSLQANQEKSKLDILEQAVQSAAAYNANFNKTRREQRRACMDLQTMNIHYPKGKLKKISMPKIGHYPVAVVPGQFTDYYKEFTPTELNNLPLNTMLYTELHKILPDVSDSDSDSSGSDSDDSSSSGSDSNSSCEDNCRMCEKRSVTPRKSPVNASI